MDHLGLVGDDEPDGAVHLRCFGRCLGGAEADGREGDDERAADELGGVARGVDRTHRDCDGGLVELVADADLGQVDVHAEGRFVRHLGRFGNLAMDLFHASSSGVCFSRAFQEILWLYTYFDKLTNFNKTA